MIDRLSIAGLAAAIWAALSACSDAPRRACGQVDGQPAAAVVLSDYLSTSIALLGRDAELLTECWIDSGAEAPGLVAALSGDVVLATDQTPGTLSVIDRFGTDVFSRVSLDEPRVLGQVRLQDPDVSGAFSSNPHDAVAVNERSVWVSRFGANRSASAPSIARGSDLLEIDPTTFERTGRRISLEPLIEPVIVDTDDGPIEKLAYPRPSRMVRVGSVIVVGLSRLTLGFDGAAPGAVAVVDLAGDSIRLHPLPSGVSNCGRVVPVPGAPDRMVVGCIGFSRPFGEETQVRASSGVFVLQVTGSTVTMTASWRPATDSSAPLAVAEVVAIGPTTVAAVDYGDDGPDRSYVVDLMTGQSELLFESAREFEIGAGVYDLAQDLLLVPDASAGLRRFVHAGGRFTERPRLPLDGGGVGLPPRSVHLLEE